MEDGSLHGNFVEPFLPGVPGIKCPPLSALYRGGSGILTLAQMRHAGQFPACPAHREAPGLGTVTWRLLLPQIDLHDQDWEGQYNGRVSRMGPMVALTGVGRARLTQSTQSTFREGSNHGGVRGAIYQAIPEHRAWAWCPWSPLRKGCKPKHVYTSKNWSWSTSQGQHRQTHLRQSQSSESSSTTLQPHRDNCPPVPLCALNSPSFQHPKVLLSIGQIVQDLPRSKRRNQAAQLGTQSPTRGLSQNYLAASAPTLHTLAHVFYFSLTTFLTLPAASPTAMSSPHT